MFEVYNNDKPKKIQEKIKKELTKYNESIQYDLIREAFEKIEEYDTLTFFRLIIDFIPTFSVNQKRYVLTFFDESVQEKELISDEIFDKYIEAIKKQEYEDKQKEKIVEIITKVKNLNLLEFC